MRDIPGYEGYYAVTRSGKVWSYPKHLKGGHWMRTSFYKTGYEKVNLSINKVVKTCKVHRLVALTYIKNPENKPWVNHKDGVKANNNDWNLEWSTVAENTQHGWDVLGRVPASATVKVCGQLAQRYLRKRIAMYSLDGIFIREYESIKDACMDIGIGESAISVYFSCKGRKSCGGYKWKIVQ